MSTLTDREKWDVKKSIENENYYASLPEHRRTAAVSTVAVLSCGYNLEYVPEAILNRNICRAALNSKNADCTILPYIPFSDVQKEAIRKFSADTPAFVLYSFADIRDAETAREAVKADAYCLQLVPDKLMTKELCRTALQSPNADEKMLKFAVERFPELKAERIPKEEKTQHNTGVKMKF
jgi:hypothetical protein